MLHDDRDPDLEVAATIAVRMGAAAS